MAVKLTPSHIAWFTLIIYAVGCFGFLFPATKPYMPQLIWVNLVFTLIMVMLGHKKWSKEFVLAALMVACVGYFIEVLGVNTGWVFGAYAYGKTLGYAYWSTPLMMMVTWLTTVYITRNIAELVAKDPLLVSMFAAALMVALDFFIEPFAIKYGMWSWANQVVPMQNYIAWFVIGVLLQYVFIKTIKMPNNKLALPIYLIQLAFFIALFLFQK
jgi:putative membrane protein